MNDGLKILLERMKTNPEEFIAESQYGVTKWDRLMQEYRPYLDKEDLEVFDISHKALVFEHMKERFTEAVMRELLAPETNTQGELDFNKTNAQHQTHVQAHLNSLQQMHDAKLMQAAKNDLLLSSNGSSVTYTSEPLVNKKPTIFGKLFNYT